MPSKLVNPQTPLSGVRILDSAQPESGFSFRAIDVGHHSPEDTYSFGRGRRGVAEWLALWQGMRLGRTSDLPWHTTGVFEPKNEDLVRYISPFQSRSGESLEDWMRDLYVQKILDVETAFAAWATLPPSSVEIDAFADFRPTKSRTHRARVRSIRVAEPDIALSEAEWRGLGLVDDSAE